MVDPDTNIPSTTPISPQTTKTPPNNINITTTISPDVYILSPDRVSLFTTTETTPEIVDYITNNPPNILSSPNFDQNDMENFKNCLTGVWKGVLKF
jgi:hypothetical protein